MTSSEIVRRIINYVDQETWVNVKSFHENTNTFFTNKQRIQLIICGPCCKRYNSSCSVFLRGLCYEVDPASATTVVATLMSAAAERGLYSRTTELKFLMVLPIDILDVKAFCLTYSRTT